MCACINEMTTNNSGYINRWSGLFPLEIDVSKAPGKHNPKKVQSFDKKFAPNIFEISQNNSG